MNNLLVAQSGGPTAAINATLAGIFQGAIINSKVDKIYGVKNGIQGVFEEKFIELNDVLKNTNDIELLCQTPAAALGSCRYKLDSLNNNEEQYELLIKVFRKYHITYFIYIGGNDSMDTVYKLSKYCQEKNIKDIFVMGAPKTIDNDLAEIDHCPGFGSAAKYIAATCTELQRDNEVYEADSVLVIEIMGRNAGWLTASSALSRFNGEKGPSLIYLCERAFDVDRFIADVKDKLKDNSSIMVAVSEGIKDCNGTYISDYMHAGDVDVFGHKQTAGVGRVLERMIKEKIGCKVRSVELNIMQRSAAHIASAADINESRMLGMKALQCAVDGISGEMASLRRKSSNPYQIEFISVPVEKVANHERKVPLELINSAGNDVTEEMITYLLPLIQGEVLVRYENGIPKHFVF